MKQLITALLVASLFAGTSCGGSRVVVGTQLSRPAYDRPRSPGSGYIWVEGDWVPSHGRYVWRQGHWARARGNRQWQEGHWVPRGKGWYWNRGHWR